MAEITTAIPLVPAAAVARVLLDAPEGVLSEREVHERVEGLVRASGGLDASNFSTRDGLDLLLLRGLVREWRGLYRVVPGQKKLLAYYAASITHPDGG
jgi:hypothetical protein